MARGSAWALLIVFLCDQPRSTRAQSPAEAPRNSVAQEATPALQPSAAPDVPIEVHVVAKGVARRLEDSAQAIQVVELEQARVESADLGTVMGRVPGVSLRRTGGLGSNTRFSLNGMQGDQIRFFIDGVPLEYLGYSFGIANVPVNLVSRVELYTGVVPIRFGADALGGAVNLVSDETLGKSKAGSSFQYGAFDTVRTTAVAQHADADTGLYARVEAFYDASANDYEVDVLVPDSSGRENERRVPRFHDAYEAHGVSVEAGVSGRPWANRLSLRGFVSGHHKDLQSDRVMSVPFGEAETNDSSKGLLLRYRNSFAEDWSLSTQTGYNQQASRFVDLAGCVYNWLAECVRERRDPGEVGVYVSKNGADQRLHRDNAFTRNLLSYHASDWLLLSLSIGATYHRQIGEDIRLSDPAIRDPLESESMVFALINGLEARLDLLGNRLQLIAFAKQYYQALSTVSGNAGETIREVDRSSHDLGAGALARYHVTRWLLGKASYEWATRLPEVVELLGDNAGVVPNPDLTPERSHNVNVGTALHLDKTTIGAWSVSFAGFLREVSDLILLMPNAFSRFSQYKNVYETRATGLVTDLRWTSPGEYVSLSGNLTTQRNIVTSSGGAFSYLEGRRLPNRPSLFGNATLGLQFSDVFEKDDRVFSNEYLSWIDQFDRGWENLGAEQYKQVIPSQLTLQLTLGYQQKRSWGGWSASVEIYNLTNAKVFDFYGAQKAGRALYAKITGELN